MALEMVPITRKEAKFFVDQHHRHLKSPPNSVFHLAVGCVKRQEVVGVALVGRPINPVHQDNFTLEVNRCATDGTRNACSKLYASAWRVAREMGYRKVITYNREGESGVSLRAAGYKVVGQVTRANRWHNRPTVDTTPFQPKLRWEISAEILEKHQRHAKEVENTKK